jgi:FkbM family methyltransferase
MNTLFPEVIFQEQISQIRTTDGVALKVCPNDLLGRHLYLIGEHERSVLDVLRAHSRPGDLLLDIGANIGYVSTFFLHKVPDSSVLAIEPQPGVLELLRENLLQFGERAKIFPVAVSNRAGTMQFAVSDSNRGDGRIDPDGSITIEAVRGDDLFRSISKIDLIKIDVQGHEENVLVSMQETLQRCQPRAILFEDEIGAVGRIKKFLGALGYKTFAIEKRLFGFALCTDSRRWVNDYLAVR